MQPCSNGRQPDLTFTSSLFLASPHQCRFQFALDRRLHPSRLRNCTFWADRPNQIEVYGEPDIRSMRSTARQVSIRLQATSRQQARRRRNSTIDRIRTCKGIVRDPRVNVEIAQYRPYYILARSRRAASYPYRLD